jgi:hypothetical protein
MDYSKYLGNKKTCLNVSPLVACNINNGVVGPTGPTGPKGEGINTNTTGQGGNAIAIGGSTQNQGKNATVVGFGAGQYNQGYNSFAAGFNTAQVNQGTDSIAIGSFAASNNQGNSSIAFGKNAGSYTQGYYCIAIGYYAGYTNQQINAIAIGNRAGSNTQGENCVAIGSYAGSTNQKNNSIAIGNHAGTNNLGAYSIVIGYGAGSNADSTCSVLANTILLNASGGFWCPSSNYIGGGGGFFVNSLNNNQIPDGDGDCGCDGENYADLSTVLMYDNVTKEIFYSASGNKTFVIDHPLDEKKYLVHACLEGPEGGVFYRGKGEIKNNERTVVVLPHYVEALAYDFSIQITPIHNKNKIKQGILTVSTIENNKFEVYGENAEFFWLVHGKRYGAYIEVEPEKEKTMVKGDGPYKWI